MRAFLSAPRRLLSGLSDWCGALVVALNPGEHHWDDEELYDESDYAIARAIIERANKIPRPAA